MKRCRRNPISAAAKARWKKAGNLAWRGTKAAARVAGKTAYHTGRIAGKSAAAAGRTAGREVKGMICYRKNPRGKVKIQIRTMQSGPWKTVLTVPGHEARKAALLVKHKYPYRYVRGVLA